VILTQNEILRLMELGDIWGRLEGSWVGVEEDVISFILSWEDVQVWNKWRMKIKWVWSANHVHMEDGCDSMLHASTSQWISWVMVYCL